MGSAHTRRALFTTLLSAAACASLGEPDPIIGRWRGDGADIVFSRDSSMRIIPHDDENFGSIDYIFPRVSWQRNGATYRLLYVYPSNLRVPAEERQAQIRGDELVVSTREHVHRYRRVTNRRN
jgi:hypothetical protein